MNNKFSFVDKKSSKDNNKSSQQNLALYASAMQEHLSKQWSGLSEHEHFFKRVDSQLNKNNRLPSLKKVNAVVDTGLTKKKTIESEKVPNKKEYVINETITKPTLAEKLGIVEGGAKNKTKLNETQWKSTKLRSIDRGDFVYPCPICQELFGLKSTVLLSCSHVFHRACLDAFERFSGRQMCPICRDNKYEKRVVFEGEYCYAQACATKIQAMWRGYNARKKYNHYRQHNPPKNPLLKEKWYLDRLTTITNRCLQETRHKEGEVEDFLNDLDATLTVSRETFIQWDARNLRECEWSIVEEKSKARESLDTECPICLSSWSKGRSRVLLSCSHVFHEVCLSNVERLCFNRPAVMQQWASAGGGGQQSTTNVESNHKCPLCRSHYSKKPLID